MKSKALVGAAAMVCVAGVFALAGLRAGPGGEARGEARPEASDFAGIPEPTLVAQVLEPDSVRLLGVLAALSDDAMEGRATGTPGNVAARALIVGWLEDAGIAPVGERYEHEFTWEASSEGVNVVGRVPGSGGTSTIILTAHYDHLGVRDGTIYNGTDDNASGTAAVLEIARLVAAAPLSSTLVVALLDAEETGLRGARAFVAEATVPLQGAIDVNLDMVARSGGLLWASGASHTPALRPILEAVAAQAPVTLRLGHDRRGAPEGDDWTNSSDHGPFHDAGVPFVYFGVEDHPDYHRPTDDFDRVDPGEYMNSVRTILMAIHALDAALPLPPSGTPE
jgi:hypothetical protein